MRPFPALVFLTFLFGGCQTPAPDAHGGLAQAYFRQDSCTAPATRFCEPCSVYCSCPQNQTASCVPGQDGGLAGSVSGWCDRRAVCSCQ